MDKKFEEVRKILIGDMGYTRTSSHTSEEWLDKTARQICQLFEPELKPDDTAPWYDRAGKAVMDIPEEARLTEEERDRAIWQEQEGAGIEMRDYWLIIRDAQIEKIQRVVIPLIERRTRKKLIKEIEEMYLVECPYDKCFVYKVCRGFRATRNCE